MRLEDEAGPAGGQVHVLIGNHEAMNLVGDLRYVSRAEYAAFESEEIVEERDNWFRAYKLLRPPAFGDAAVSRETFDLDFPAGFFAHRRAFSPEGKYGRWLLKKPVIVVINGTAFVHGGLSPMISERGLQGVNGVLLGEMNTYVRQLQILFEQKYLLPTDNQSLHANLLADFLPWPDTDPGLIEAVADIVRLHDSDLHASDGPLWYRGNVLCNEVIEGDRLDASLQAIGAYRVVIGHTPTVGRRILQRFNGRIIEIDTGMLADYYRGSGNALVIEQDRVFVINQGSTEAVPPTPHPRHVGSRPDASISADEMEVLLRSGEIINKKTDSAGRTVVSIDNGGRSIEAEFVRRRRKGFYPEVAAYRLDRMLKFDMVPVTVRREVDGKDGSLQFLPTGWINEYQRQNQGIGGSAWCPLPDQWKAMIVFDKLILNKNRTAKSMRYDLRDWLLIIDGHEGAFSTSTLNLTHHNNVAIEVGPGWKAALAALSDDALAEQLVDVLGEKRVRALGKRRDLLINL